MTGSLLPLGDGHTALSEDDLDGLLGVADLHPDPSGFESWLRGAFRREADPDGVTLSTIHRVKGREWDRVLVFGVSEGIVPHRLAEDVEEERRVLHVGITRGRHRVAGTAGRLHSLSPLAVLGRGYSLTRLPSGEIVRSVRQVGVGHEVDVLLSEGTLACRVSATKERDERPEI